MSVQGTAAAPALLWAPAAWVGGRWQAGVLLRAGADGLWAEVRAGVAAPPGAEVLPGPVLPSLVNAHSHAFQRAFVGLAERRDSAHDDFWSWRDRMYGVALRITPAQLRALAAQLYAELLDGGYTQVCEFHYLQHAPDGSRYADPAAMLQALADAAAEVGIGLTLLPVLYERAGFTQPALRDDQRRFATSADEVLALQRAAAGMGALVTAGVAVHSLRAARPASIVALAERSSGPLHVHVAEQTAEVDDCLAATGCRPIDWLARHAPLDARWQLVHATHSVPGEIAAVARAGAGVVLCPGTEANLGDGLADLPGWLAAGVPLSVGSDSQVLRAWPEELRWLEYGQRLALRQRNVAADPGHEPATAARLFERVRAGGAAAAGLPRWGLEPGARADLLLLDASCPGLAGLPASHLLDGLVFAAAARPFARVLVAGRWRWPDDAAVAARAGRAAAVMHQLWAQ
ncbi:formimidoylglutamate deiminase [Rubrivivax sp. RP6-9]|uniref:formimidoylglutamate deiminase n=1 Tax=Rubrivivax sp. RP6-9 TaxID=3415750 RepID=UPI003CC69609